MKKVSLLVSLSIVCSGTSLVAQVVTGNRLTRTGNNCAVYRTPNPPSAEYWQGTGLPGPPPDLALLRSAEVVEAWLFHAGIEVSVTKFKYIRNCHDYAWSPFMSCMCLPKPDGPQKECWWMNYPSVNWLEVPPS